MGTFQTKIWPGSRTPTAVNDFWVPEQARTSTGSANAPGCERCDPMSDF